MRRATRTHLVSSEPKNLTALPLFPPLPHSPLSPHSLQNKLSAKFKVQGIPTLVILDENGDTVTKDGRAAVAGPQKFPWVPPTLLDALGKNGYHFFTSRFAVVKTHSIDATQY